MVFFSAGSWGTKEKQRTKAKNHVFKKIRNTGSCCVLFSFVFVHKKIGASKTNLYVVYFSDPFFCCWLTFSELVTMSTSIGEKKCWLQKLQ